MGSVKFDYSKVIGFIKQHEIDCMQSYVDQAHKMIHEKTGLGNDFLGWVDLPKNYNKEEFSRIKKAAEKVKIRFRCTCSYRYRRFLLRCKCSY